MLSGKNLKNNFNNWSVKGLPQTTGNTTYIKKYVKTSQRILKIYIQAEVAQFFGKTPKLRYSL